MAARLSAIEVTCIVIDTKDGKPVADAVVSLVPLDSSIVPPAGNTAANTVSVEQRNQQFIPFVSAVRTGATLTLPNRDKVEHHAYSQSPAKKFEFPLYKPGRAEQVVLDKPGVVTIGCNIHDSMIAHVVVLDVPWFAITPIQGTAVLRDVPAGRYRAEVWHPRVSKPLIQEIAVTAEPVSLKFSLELKPDRRKGRLLDGAKGGYR